MSREKTTPGEHIRGLREDQGRSLLSVAKQAGIDPAQLFRVERNTAGLSVERLHRLLEVLDPIAARILEPYVRDDDGD